MNEKKNEKLIELSENKKSQTSKWTGAYIFSSPGISCINVHPFLFSQKNNIKKFFCSFFNCKHFENIVPLFQMKINLEFNFMIDYNMYNNESSFIFYSNNFVWLDFIANDNKKMSRKKNIIRSENKQHGNVFFLSN